MKKIMLLIFALVMIGSAFAQVDITIGTGTSTGRYPLNDYFVYSRSQCIYLESEIGSPGTIHELRWYRNDVGADAAAIGTTEIWVKTTTSAVVPDGTWEDPGTLVATITDIDLGAGGGWYTIDIDDFAYTGGNLMVSAYTQNAPYTTPHALWRYTTTTGFNRCRLGNSDSANPPTMSVSTSRPNIQINMTTSAPSTVPNAAILAAPVSGAWAFLDQVMSWNNGGGFPDSYDVYLDTVDGSTLVSDNQIGTTYTPTLAANTTYYWKVIASNVIGDAAPSPVWSFKTPSTTQVAESFENTTFPPTGWVNGTTGNWTRSTSYYKHGVASAYKYGSSTTQYILSGPKVTITGTSTLNFWSLCSGTTGTLQVVYSPDRVTWTQIGANVTYAATYTMYESTIDLSSLAGNNYYIGFRTGLQAVSWYVDRVFGPEITPEAPGPVTLSLPADLATNVLEYTTFTWTAPATGGVPTGYRVYCDTNPTPTTQVADVTGLTTTLTLPLAYNTMYYWTVEAYNATGPATTPAPRSFTTRADPTITVFPHVVDFGTIAGDWPVLNWSQLNGLYGGTYTNGTQWLQDDWLNVAAANKAAKINIYGTVRYGWLVTPPVQIPAVDYEIKFDMALLDWNGTVPPVAGEQADDRLLLVMSDSPLMTSPTILREWNNTGSPDTFDGIPATGQNYTVALTGITGIKYFAWYGESTVSGGDNDLMIDNIQIRQTPAAPIFVLTPTDWDFGTVQINTTATKQFAISNNGGGTINVSSLALTDLYYSITVDPTPVALGAGQTAYFTVEYAPLAEGTHAGTVVITDDRAIVNVPLTAACIDPTVDAFPYTESFDDATFAPTGWTNIRTAGTSNPGIWDRQTAGTSPTCAPYSGAAMARFNAYSISTGGKAELITPPIAIPVGEPYRMKFWMYRDTGYATNAELVNVYENATPTSVGGTLLGTIHRSTTLAPVVAAIGWYQYEFFLNVESARTNRYIVFEAVSAYGNNIFIDEILFEAVPATAVLNLVPTSWDFGLVPVGASATKQFTISNTGAGSLDISDIAISGLYYAFTVDYPTLPLSLLTNESATFTVEYTPLLAGTHTGSVTITDGRAVTNVPLNGAAYEPSVLPLTEDFEAGFGDFIVVNGTQTNTWNAGTATAHAPSLQSAYISNDAGVSYLYTDTAASVVHMYQDIYFDDNSVEFQLDFWWNGIGETGWDFLKVYVVDTSVVPVEGVQLTTGQVGLTEYNAAADWTQAATVVLPGTLSDSVKRLVFSWRNDTSVAGLTPAAIDDVSLVAIPDLAERPDAPILTAPADLSIDLPITSNEFTWTRGVAGGSPAGYYFSIVEGNDQDAIDRLFTVDALYNADITTTSHIPAITYTYTTVYSWAVMAYNTFGDSDVSAVWSFTTRDVPAGINTFPWLETFEGLTTFPPDEWAMVDVDGGGTAWQYSTLYNHTAGGTQTVRHAYSTAVPDPGQDGWLITPAVHMPATGNMVLSWWNYNIYPTWMVYNGVLVNTVADPADPGWVELWAPATVATAWSNAVVNISAYNGQTVYFAFNYAGYDGDDWYVDDVSIYELLVDTIPPTITHLPVLNTLRDDIPYTVYIDVVDDATWNNPIGGANLYYATDGVNYTMVPMTPDVAPGYYADIPAQVLDTQVDYYVEAWDTLMNTATTDVFTFFVEDPTWIWYDQGGTTYLGYASTASFTSFGPTVLFENPLYGTSNNLLLLGTDGAAYDNVAATNTDANLHVYSYDGVDIVDLITPIPVSFPHTTYMTFDLTTYNIEISTPYFMIAYEDVPVDHYVLFDGTYDYGTTYVEIEDTLYTMSTPGSWAIGANVTTGSSAALDTPVVTITQTAGVVEISWVAVAGASSYIVYGADDPYAADPWTIVTTTDLLAHTYAGTEGYKFFKVVASSDPIPFRNTVFSARRFSPQMSATSPYLTVQAPKLSTLPGRSKK